jgi:transposase
MTNPKKERIGIKQRASLPVIQPKAGGIDVGSTKHCVAGPANPDGTPNVRSFGTTTDQLEALGDWLSKQGVVSVAMESTYVYWIPIYEVLAARGIEVVLVNARQLHNVPGRKTDVADCQWIQLLHSYGLLRASFRPGEAITRLRALQRQMANLVAQRTRLVQWMQQALDQMNVQVHRAVTDLTGVTGMAIVRAIVAGERDPARLAEFRHPRCKKSPAEIAQYLTGNWRKEHLFNLAATLKLFDTLEETIRSYDQQLLAELQALQPPERENATVPRHPNRTKEIGIRSRGEQETRTALWRFAGVDLTRIDGISAGTAQVVLTEIGTDLSAFPSEDNFVSWLRLCPRTPITGGKPVKKKRQRNGLGANRIASALRMGAASLDRSKSAIGAAYRRMARRKGAEVAIFDTARRLAKLVYRMLRYGTDYVDIGETAYEERFKARRLKSVAHVAKSLGFALVPNDATA